MSMGKDAYGLTDTGWLMLVGIAPTYAKHKHARAEQHTEPKSATGKSEQTPVAVQGAVRGRPDPCHCCRRWHRMQSAGPLPPHKAA